VEVFGLNSEGLLLAFLCARVAYQLTQESTSEQVLRVAEEKIKYICFKIPYKQFLSFKLWKM